MPAVDWRPRRRQRAAQKLQVSFLALPSPLHLFLKRAADFLFCRGFTPLLSCNDDFGDMPDVEEGRVLEVCRLLLHAKADVNVTDYTWSSPQLHACELLNSFCFFIRGRTPLNYAVDRGRVDVCRLLLQEKADVSADSYSPFPCMRS